MENLNIANITSKVRPMSLDWLISFKNPVHQWNDNWFAVMFEIVTAVLCIQAYRHAKRRSSESHYMILTAIISTLSFELLPLMRTGYELWWYHPGILNFVNQRVPSYVISFYVITHYFADSLTEKSNLPYFTRAVVSAVAGILIAFPFLWMAPRLLLITYHFDDPVFQDRLFNVPYIQILILLLLFFHTSHLYRDNMAALQPQEKHVYNYIGCALQSGLVAAIYTIVEQYVIYLLLNLTLHLNTATCVLFALTVMGFIAKEEIKRTSISSSGLPLKEAGFMVIAVGLIFLATLPLWISFDSLKSTGNRLEFGPCRITHEISNTSPLEITRRRYVCPEDAKQLPYDFHCMPENEMKIEKNYTICGKPVGFQTAGILTVYSSICLFIIHTLTRISFPASKKDLQCK